jgi:hypothetical protein
MNSPGAAYERRGGASEFPTERLRPGNRPLLKIWFVEGTDATDDIFSPFPGFFLTASKALEKIKQHIAEITNLLKKE